MSAAARILSMAALLLASLGAGSAQGLGGGLDTFAITQMQDCAIEPRAAARCALPDLEVANLEKTWQSCPDACFWVTGWVEQRSLLRFDLASIPAGTRIQEARLSLTETSGFGAAPAEIAVHAVTSPWTNEASWEYRSGPPNAANRWTRNGGDYAADSESRLTFPGGAGTGIQTWDLTRLARGWHDGTIANNGMLLRLDPPPFDPVTERRLKVDRIFASGENPDAALRPVLKIYVDRTAPPPPRDFRAERLMDGTLQLSWEDDLDPLLADDRPPSGVVETAFRYRVDQGPWGTWSSDPDGLFLAGITPGQVIEIEAKAIDGAGNESSVAVASLVAPPFERPWTSDELAAFDQDTVGFPDWPAWSPSAAAPVCPDPVENPGYRDPVCLPSDLYDLFDPYLRNPHREDILRCRGNLRRQLGPTRTDRLCKGEPEWVWIYRLRETPHTNVIYYVGITNDLETRCRRHGRPRLTPNGTESDENCQAVMRVPWRGVALAIEQFLMEVYGLNSTRVKAFNYDFAFPRELFRGWLNDRPRSLTGNRRNNYTPRIDVLRPLYCAQILEAIPVIHHYPPFIHGVRAPGTRAWWQNFPGRDCVSPATVERMFRLFEAPNTPANPR